jgi:hypothetical protein
MERRGVFEALSNIEAFTVRSPSPLQGMTLAQAGHHLGVSKQHVRNLLILGVKYGATGWKHPEDYIGFRYFGGMRYLRAEARRLFLSNTVENL